MSRRTTMAALGIVATVAVLVSSVDLLAARPAAASESTATASTTASGAPASVATCTPTAESSNARGVRCINGTELGSRGYNSCLVVPHALVPDIYLPNECYGQDGSKTYIEAIAQSRLVQALNPAHAGVVVSPVQWEVDLSRDALTRMTGTPQPSSLRPDVMLVGPGASDPSTNQVYIIELKVGAENMAEGLDQALRYVDALRRAGWSSTALAPLTFRDNFRVVYECVSGASSGPVYEYFRSYDIGMGVVITEKTGEDECEGERRRYPNHTRVAAIAGVTITQAAPPTIGNHEILELLSADEPADPDTPPPGDVTTDNEAALNYLSEAYLRGLIARLLVLAGQELAKRAAFEALRYEICLGPVNVLTRSVGDGSVTAEAQACLELTTVVSIASLLGTLGIPLDLDAEELRELGLDAEAVSTSGGVSSPAQVRGDPRLVTLDGLNYDFHGVGEYLLFAHSDTGLEVQMRTIAAQNSMSSVGSLVVKTGGLVFELRPDRSVLINGDPIDPTIGNLIYFGNGVLLSRSSTEIQLLSAFDDSTSQALIGWTPRPGSRGDFRLSLPNAWQGQVKGMLGNFDGNPRNDLTSASGVDVTASLAFGASSSLHLQRLYGTFGDSWRLSDETSWFTHPDGKRVADYVDPSYPGNVTSLGDLSPEAFEMASGICGAAGLTPGIAFDDCLLDVGSSGDTSFAASLASRDTFGIGLGDAFLGDGPLTVTFDGAIPPNFFPSFVRSLGGSQNYAGNYSSTGYPFYLNDLPGHSAFDMSARIVVDTFDPGAAPIRLVLDDKIVPGSVDPASVTQILLPDGSSAVVMDVDFHATHSLRETVGRLDLVASAGATWFGVDDITVDVARVPFELFEVVLEPGVEFDPLVSLPNTGAGIIESLGTTDRYCFDLPTDSSLVINGGRFDRPLEWRFWSPTNSFDSLSGHGTAALAEHLSGTGCLEVRVHDASVPDRWKYRLLVTLLPATPQVFQVDLTDADRVASQGLGIGAAELESSVSIDEYRFTVPSGGQRVLMNWWTAPGYSSSGHAALDMIGPGGQSVWSVADVSGLKPTMDEVLPAGDYIFRVSGLPLVPSGAIKGPYDFVLVADSPALSQTFNADLSVAGVENTFKSTTASGAGLLESSASADHYAFSLASSGPVVIKFSGLGTYATAPILWKIVDSTGATVDSGGFKSDSARTFDIAAGDYTLILSRNSAVSDPNYWGAPHSVQLMRVPEPQVFAADLSDIRRVSLQGLGSGAANLESSASVDDYGFTVPAGGQRVVLNWWAAPGTSGSGGHAALSLIGPDGQVVWSVADVYLKRPIMDLNLPEGDYVFRVAGLPLESTHLRKGPYDFLLFTPTAALTQTFPVDLSTAGLERTLQTGTTPGAGVLETSESVDKFTFTVPAGSAIVLSISGGTYNPGPTLWRLTDSAGAVVDSGEFKASFSKTISGLSGDYTLTLSRNPAAADTTSWSTPLTLKFKRL
jgi:hypothetical protein